jgi:hypothetical protein
VIDGAFDSFLIIEPSSYLKNVGLPMEINMSFKIQSMEKVNVRNVKVKMNEMVISPYRQ